MSTATAPACVSRTGRSYSAATLGVGEALGFTVEPDEAQVFVDMRAFETFDGVTSAVTIAVHWDAIPDLISALVEAHGALRAHRATR